MTDTDLNIAIAKRKGWTECRVQGRNPGGVSPEGGVARAIPTYTADPREWGPMLEGLLRSGKVRTVSYYAAGGGYLIEYANLDVDGAPTLGRAVAEAWLACNQATPSRPEGQE